LVYGVIKLERSELAEVNWGGTIDKMARGRIVGLGLLAY